TPPARPLAVAAGQAAGTGGTCGAGPQSLPASGSVWYRLRASARCASVRAFPESSYRSFWARAIGALRAAVARFGSTRFWLRQLYLSWDDVTESSQVVHCGLGAPWLYAVFGS